MVTCLVLSNVNAYVIGNKLTKSAANGQSNIAYSQDNKGSYQFAYEVTDKGGATNFRQETGGPKAVKGICFCVFNYNLIIYNYILDQIILNYIKLY